MSKLPRPFLALCARALIYRKIKNRFPMVAMFRQEGKFPELSSRGRPFES